jgi:hypothetical protein
MFHPSFGQIRNSDEELDAYSSLFLSLCAYGSPVVRETRPLLLQKKISFACRRFFSQYCTIIFDYLSDA